MLVDPSRDQTSKKELANQMRVKLSTLKRHFAGINAATGNILKQLGPLAAI